jgi:hypothetical protein
LTAFAATSAASEDPITQALALFSSQEVASMPQVVLAEIKPEGLRAATEGFVVAGDSVIYVAAWSDTYSDAKAGDRDAILKLASIIAHERTHIEHGLSERGAYEEQIKMLRRCGAPPRLIDGVRRSMQAVLR